jgi:predicted metal-dependent phosphoesterase TrpH
MSNLTAAIASTTSDECQVLRQIFTLVEGDSCPSRYNFHMHTVCSDGKLTPVALMEQVVGIGLQAFAITDHHSLAGFELAKAWLEDWRWRHPLPFSSRSHPAHQGLVHPRLFTGIEITALLAEIEVHILGYGFIPHHDALAPYLQGYGARSTLHPAGLVIAAIQRAGGLAVLAHPARYRLPLADLIEEVASLGIDGVEAYYAYTNPETWSPCPIHTPQVLELARRYRLLTTCGTDTHGGNLLRRL